MEETIFIASDHAGFDLKKQILNSIENNLVDLGVDNKNNADYPDYAKMLVSKINSTKNSKGILICGSGIGMSIAANRDKNIRAGLAFEPEIAKLMREHNDANVLVLPGRFMNLQDILKCIENFLTTNFEGGRHQNRINKLS
jgi:ribose 5-phosphate isomerase B